MRLVPKLSFYLAGAMSLVFVWRGAAQVYRDTDVFDTDMKHDHRVVGKILLRGLENALREGSEEKVAGLTAAANGATGAMHFSWQKGKPLGTAMDQHFEQGDEHGQELVSRFALNEGPMPSYLELREPLVDRERFVRSSILSMLLGVAVSIAAAGFLTLLLNRAVVGEPIAALVDRARRIGKGDLGTEGRLDAADELVALWSELDAMCVGLAGANERAKAEADARMHVTEQMRHAERLATVGKLAAGVAHELGTPLSVAAGHAEMIRLGEVRDAGVVTSAEAVEAQIARASKIVRQLLDFARRTGREHATCDPVVVAQQVSGMMESLARKRNVAIAIERSEGDDAALAEIAPERLAQVLTNLVGNALDASHNGGTVRVSVTRQDEWVRIDVADEGAGIAEENLPRVFEPFFTTKDVGEGTGLGLSVVHGIVQDQGGRVEVSSRLSEGTTFSVYLERHA